MTKKKIEWRFWNPDAGRRATESPGFTTLVGMKMVELVINRHSTITDRMLVKLGKEFSLGALDTFTLGIRADGIATERVAEDKASKAKAEKARAVAGEKRQRALAPGLRKVREVIKTLTK